MCQKCVCAVDAVVCWLSYCDRVVQWFVQWCCCAKLQWSCGQKQFAVGHVARWGCSWQPVLSLSWAFRQVVSSAVSGSVIGFCVLCSLAVQGNTRLIVPSWVRRRCAQSTASAISCGVQLVGFDVQGVLFLSFLQWPLGVFVASVYWHVCSMLWREMASCSDTWLLLHSSVCNHELEVTQH